MAQVLTKTITTRVDIQRALCKKCGICLAFCPAGVFARNERGEVIVAHAESCKHCGLCQSLCPDYAVTAQEAIA
ncbi:4Fe-4S dicluster domain-containing protein [Desulfotomaculum copahuensis]|uniref:4Fe-4S ferredoxin-type domain-containing protein n=1 Tax=Desulfotomaculum copahuensis TaxID=1838280 RepID=A0A1B7LI09_9FIRM|nr:4Fe-4S dicluster domain-containing protein [Desulfotomaculum copahuensis]OAT85824.1 hypothetical protein A6M21_04910 [Desulfotomaculum copahuensis]